MRAERAGPGNGRQYVVHFTATDTFGEPCSGTVTVGVVSGWTLVDDGQALNALTP